MLRQASLAEIAAGIVARAKGHYVVIAMQRYPRWIRKGLRDEYARDLAPSLELFSRFRAKRQQTGDHNRAFRAVAYERTFSLTPEGVAHLRTLAALSRERDVFLACHCGNGERCHRELLLLIARSWHVRTSPLRFSYPRFEERIKRGEI